MKRTPIRSRRVTPRRRTSPRWSASDWDVANLLLMARCGGLCEMCGQSLAGRMERAHRVKRRDGGDRLSNILALHPECHAWTHANPIGAGARGLMLGTHLDPAEIPFLWRGAEWAALDDAGRLNRLPLGSDYRLVG